MKKVQSKWREFINDFRVLRERRKRKIVEVDLGTEVEAIEYVTVVKWPFLYRIMKGIQWLLWKCDIYWHDSLYNECTPDGGCCCPNLRRKAIKEREEQLELERMCSNV